MCVLFPALIRANSSELRSAGNVKPPGSSRPTGSPVTEVSRDDYCGWRVSAFACSSQNPMSILRYIAVAAVSCSPARSRLPVRR